MGSIENGEGSSGEDGGSNSNEEVVFGYMDMFNTCGDVKPVQMYLITQKEFKVGRDHSCEIRIHNLRISRQQCLVTVPETSEDSKGIYVKNITSKQTTVCKNSPLAENQQVLIEDGERFRLYDAELRWRAYNPANKSGQPSKDENTPVVRLSIGNKDNRTPKRKSEKLNASGTPVSSPSAPPSPSKLAGRKSMVDGTANNSSRTLNPERPPSPKRRRHSDVDLRKAVLKKSLRKSVQQMSSFTESYEPPEGTIDEEETDNKDSDSATAQEDEASSQNHDGVATSEEQNQDESSVAIPSNTSAISESGEDISTAASPTVSLLAFPSDSEKDLIVLSSTDTSAQSTSNDLIRFESSAESSEVNFEDIEREMEALHNGSDDNQTAASPVTVEKSSTAIEPTSNEKSSTAIEPSSTPVANEKSMSLRSSMVKTPSTPTAGKETPSSLRSTSMKTPVASETSIPLRSASLKTPATPSNVEKSVSITTPTSTKETSVSLRPSSLRTRATPTVVEQSISKTTPAAAKTPTVSLRSSMVQTPATVEKPMAVATPVVAKETPISLRSSSVKTPSTPTVAEKSITLRSSSVKTPSTPKSTSQIWGTPSTPKSSVVEELGEQESFMTVDGGSAEDKQVDAAAVQENSVFETPGKSQEKQSSILDVSNTSYTTAQEEDEEGAEPSDSLTVHVSDSPALSDSTFDQEMSFGGQPSSQGNESEISENQISMNLLSDISTSSPSYQVSSILENDEDEDVLPATQINQEQATTPAAKMPTKQAPVIVNDENEEEEEEEEKEYESEISQMNFSTASRGDSSLLDDDDISVIPETQPMFMNSSSVSINTQEEEIISTPVVKTPIKEAPPKDSDEEEEKEEESVEKEVEQEEEDENEERNKVAFDDIDPEIFAQSTQMIIQDKVSDEEEDKEESSSDSDVQILDEKNTSSRSLGENSPQTTPTRKSARLGSSSAGGTPSNEVGTSSRKRGSTVVSPSPSTPRSTRRQSDMRKAVLIKSVQKPAPATASPSTVKESYQPATSVESSINEDAELEDFVDALLSETADDISVNLPSVSVLAQKDADDSVLPSVSMLVQKDADVSFSAPSDVDVSVNLPSVSMLGQMDANVSVSAPVDDDVSMLAEKDVSISAPNDGDVSVLPSVSILGASSPDKNKTVSSIEIEQQNSSTVEKEVSFSTQEEEDESELSQNKSVASLVNPSDADDDNSIDVIPETQDIMMNSSDIQEEIPTATERSPMKRKSVKVSKMEEVEKEQESEDEDNKEASDNEMEDEELDMDSTQVIRPSDKTNNWQTILSDDGEDEEKEEHDESSSDNDVQILDDRNRSSIPTPVAGNKEVKSCFVVQSLL